MTTKNYKKAVFWDRDGVLNVVSNRDGIKNVGPQKFENFKLTENIGKVFKATKLAGFLNIVVTNQPDVSRNIISWQELDRMHDFLKAEAPEIDAIYVCPHTTEENCTCRKPKPGMFLEAAKDYKIDLSKSYMVGDTQKDIDAGHAAGVKTILYQTFYNGDVTGFDFGIKNLEEIKDVINSN